MAFKIKILTINIILRIYRFFQTKTTTTKVVSIFQTKSSKPFKNRKISKITTNIVDTIKV